MPTIHIHLRCDREIAVSDDEQYDEATVEEMLNSGRAWAVTRADGTRIVIPHSAIEYVLFSPRPNGAPKPPG